MKYSNKEQFKNDVEELLGKIGSNFVEKDNVLTATLNTSFSCSALGSMHLLDNPSNSKNITINLDNYNNVNEGNLEGQYLNKCRIYVLTGFRKDIATAQITEAKNFLNEKMNEIIQKPQVQLDHVTAELSQLRNKLKKWDGVSDIQQIADGIDLKSAVSTAILVKLLGKKSRISTSVGNNSTEELLDSANTQGGGGQPEDTKKLRKPRNQSNQLGENLNASSNSNVEMNASTVAPLVGANTLGGGGQTVPLKQQRKPRNQFNQLGKNLDAISDSNVEMNASTVAPLVGANTLGGGGQNEEIVNTSVTIPEVIAQKRALNASILNVFESKNTGNKDVNNSTVELLDSANTLGGGGQTVPLKQQRKPRNQSNQLVVDSNASSNLSEQSIFKDSASNSPSSQNSNLDNLKELCTQPFEDYKNKKISEGRWETKVDQGKKDILENVKDEILNATSIEQIETAINNVISSAQTKPSSFVSGLFQTFKKPGELHTAALVAQRIFEDNKDKVQSSQNASSNKPGSN
jgi:hypothetical protein